MSEGFAEAEDGASPAWVATQRWLAAARAALNPALRFHLIDAGSAWLSDAAIARVRAMLDGLGGQLTGEAHAIQAAARLADDASLLGHLHALALEGLATERMAHLARLDPVVSPLVRQMANDGEAAAPGAQAFIAAQTSFLARQKQMRLAMADLDPTMAQAAAAALVGLAPGVDTFGPIPPMAYRIALAAELAAPVPAHQALDPAFAGVALFASALAGRTALPRDSVILLLQPGRGAALAEAMRAAGAAAGLVATAVAYFDPAAAGSAAL